MFQAFTQRLRDARTLSTLCTQAEAVARRQGRAKPGSEHFVLAALSLADPSARDTFRQLGVTEAAFLDALAAQRADALEAVGITLPMTDGDTARLSPPPMLYETEPSGQSLVQRLAETRHERRERGLLAADVLIAAAQERFSPCARAFKRLGLTPERLVESATRTIDSQVHAHP